MADKLWVATGSTGDLNVAANYSPSGVPVAGDNLRFPPGTAPVTTNLTRLNNATLGGSLGRVVFQAGYESKVGTDQPAPAYMQFTCTGFEFSGRGKAFIDLEASNIDVTVNETEAPSIGARGLNLKGSNLKVINVRGGHVGVAVIHGETSTITRGKVIAQGASLWLGRGVTAAGVDVLQGAARIRCALSSGLEIYAGEVITEEEGAIPTVNIYGGLFVPNSTGTITTLNHWGGEVDELRSGLSRTITTYSQKSLGTCTLRRNKDSVTHGTDVMADKNCVILFRPISGGF